MKTKIRMFIGKEGDTQARIESTPDGILVLYPVPKGNLIALLNGDVKALDLE